MWDRAWFIQFLKHHSERSSPHQDRMWHKISCLWWCTWEYTLRSLVKILFNFIQPLLAWDQAQSLSAGHTHAEKPIPVMNGMVLSTIPFILTETNRHRLEWWIHDHFKSSVFNTGPHQPLQTITGMSYDMTFIPDARSSVVYTHSLRCTVELPILNAASMRETHQMAPHLIRSLSFWLRQEKTVVDAWNGYHS